MAEEVEKKVAVVGKVSLLDQLTSEEGGSKKVAEIATEVIKDASKDTRVLPVKEE